MSYTDCYYVSASSHLPFTEYVSDISHYVEKIKKDNCLPRLVEMNMPKFTESFTCQCPSMPGQTV